MKKLLISQLSLTLLLGGCGASIFADPATNPIIEDSVGAEVGTLATTANRRLVLINKNTGKYCAESSPDSVASFASLLSTSAKADVSKQGSGSVALAKALVSTSGVITKRSQGLQFYRDGVFAYCQALSNGYISRMEYQKALIYLRKDAMKLAAQEIAKPNWDRKPEVAIVKLEKTPFPAAGVTAPPLE